MATEEQYKIGDIVKLKSGGPNMTVGMVLAKGRYRCQWFAGSKDQSADFWADALVRVTDEPKK